MKRWGVDVEMRGCFHFYLFTGIEIAVRHWALSDKKGYKSGTHHSWTFCPVLYLECHMWKILEVKTHLAYYKSIVKSLYTFTQGTIK